METKSENVLLMGGGIDSNLAFLRLVQLKIDFIPLFVDYGQATADGEISACRKLSKKYEKPLITTETNLIHNYNREPSIVFGTSDEDLELNGRNLSLIMIAAQYGKNIYIGLSKPYKYGNGMSDASLAFLSLINDLLVRSFSDGTNVIAPFIETEKIDVIRDMLKFDPNLMEETMTCWKPMFDSRQKKFIECSNCSRCRSKQKLRIKLMEDARSIKTKLLIK